ncbi:hypothetical protein [Bizionia paragorgiae]|uniref:PH domain-containing protein n=1 Tax=Bizionia paragorgiae TaxID=283786 RepID=A0A1H4C4V0_BIZPA|nr:hypothetical protein [Bizionia paragorgiae]SEA55323.1 hypothetical protein SAMN04487990_1183 [Bizionia paragorgiae]
MDTYKWTGIRIIIHIIVLFFFSFLPELPDFLGVIMGIIALSLLVHVFFIIILPFTITKKLIFLVGNKKGVIEKKLIGFKSPLMDLNRINRVVVTKEAKYYYFTFREKKRDKIQEKTPILAVEASNLNEYNTLVAFIKDHFLSGTKIDLTE